MQPSAEQLHVAPWAQVMVQPPPLHEPIEHVSPARQSTLHPPPEQSTIDRVEGAAASLAPGPT